MDGKQYTTRPDYSKAHLAELCGVCSETLRKYIEPFVPELEQMGYNRNQRVFTPKQWGFLMVLMLMVLNQQI